MGSFAMSLTKELALVASARYLLKRGPFAFSSRENYSKLAITYAVVIVSAPSVARASLMLSPLQTLSAISWRTWWERQSQTAAIA
jgi:hypothetical protein